MTPNLGDSIQSTKFIMSAICLIMVFIAFIMDKLTAEIFMQFVLGILATYTLGNTVSKFADPKSAN
jgi:predicted PurR-regulated permease PerM